MKKYEVYKNLQTNTIFQIQEIDFERFNQLGEVYFNYIDTENNKDSILYDDIEEFNSKNEKIEDNEIVNKFRKLYNINYFTSKVSTLSYSEAISLYKSSFSKTDKFLYIKPFLDLKYSKYCIDYTLKYNTKNNKLLESMLSTIEKNKFFCSKNQFLKLIEIIKI